MEGLRSSEVCDLTSTYQDKSGVYVPYGVCAGAVLTHKWFCVWGRKASVLVNRADRRKDWQEKANSGYFVEYSKDNKGWGVYIHQLSLLCFLPMSCLIKRHPIDRPCE